MEPAVSILIPNFRTPVLTKLCLRSLRKYTDLSRVKILVIDNGSGEGEESLTYLRSLKWITLVENHPDPSTPPAEIHSRSLDKLTELADTEYILSIHTDTIVLRPDWLDYLLSKIRNSERCAGVGSWKLEFQSPVKRFGKAIEDFFRIHVLHPITGCRISVAGVGDNYRYLRSHCALYRRDPVVRLTHGFFDGLSAGKSLHKMLCDRGYEMTFLPERELGQYVTHFDHATMVLNPEIGGRRTTKPKAKRRVSGLLGQNRWSEILDDSSLDN